ncbi:MAG: sugar phosphate isomerase/epimerase [Capsulimonadales bacterium]|nr:sugar phosphate isomerase/epimerase [Capsulimonadales bacterium]
MAEKIPVGLQMYTVRDDAAKDFAGTVKTIAEIGYAGVELAGYAGLTAAEAKKVLDDNGLAVFGGHVGYDQMTNNLEQVIDEFSAFGAKYVAVPWIGNEWRNSLDDYRRLGAALNEIGAKLTAAGITLCYHNHDFEFNRFGGDVYGFDALFAAAEPANLQVEMDTFWVKKAGEDPVAYVTKYAGRLPLVHLKDMTPDGDFAPVGEGTIDYIALTGAAEAAGTKYFIVEQDVCRTHPPLESVRISFENLRKLGKV